jgi:predicted transcriptional regulator YdeE
MPQSNHEQAEANQENPSYLTEKAAFTAVGMRWEGSFAEAGAGSIRAMHQRFLAQYETIPNRVPSPHFYGLSYHAAPNASGFVHYAVVEVSEIADVPDGMLKLEVPSLTYARCDHRKGQSIDRSYQNIGMWIEAQGYRLADTELTHFELYPLIQDPYSSDPEFTIMMPVEKA